jgi:hypothetical protein
MTPDEQQALLDAMHTEISILAAQIDVPLALLPQRKRSRNGTWITLGWHKGDEGDDPDGWYMSLMRNEDGADWGLAEVLAEHSDYLLYVLFDDITSRLARSTFGTADRRSWFAAQEELLGRLNEGWRARATERHAQMLKS